jgi:hypothetical protein
MRSGKLELERLGNEAQELLTGRSFVHAGPPPVAFRERASGLLQIVYQEIVVRFDPATPERRRRGILRREGFEVRRVNPFFPEQVVVRGSRRSLSAEAALVLSVNPGLRGCLESGVYGLRPSPPTPICVNLSAN